MSAAPAPCPARIPISMAPLVDKPAISEGIVKSTNPARNTGRAPNRSASMPPHRVSTAAETVYTLTTHCSPARPRPRSRPSEGSAIAIAWSSRTTRNGAKAATPSTHHLRPTSDALVGPAPARSSTLLALLLNSAAIGVTTGPAMLMLIPIRPLILDPSRGTSGSRCRPWLQSPPAPSAPLGLDSLVAIAFRLHLGHVSPRRRTSRRSREVHLGPDGTGLDCRALSKARHDACGEVRPRPSGPGRQAGQRSYLGRAVLALSPLHRDSWRPGPRTQRATPRRGPWGTTPPSAGKHHRLPLPAVATELSRPPRRPPATPTAPAGPATRPTQGPAGSSRPGRPRQPALGPPPPASRGRAATSGATGTAPVTGTAGTAGASRAAIPPAPRAARQQGGPCCGGLGPRSGGANGPEAAPGRQAHWQ